MSGVPTKGFWDSAVQTTTVILVRNAQIMSARLLLNVEMAFVSQKKERIAQAVKETALVILENAVSPRPTRPTIRDVWRLKKELPIRLYVVRGRNMLAIAVQTTNAREMRNV